MSIWNDPRVQVALKEREPCDIAVLACPHCGTLGYYNEGSHFTCLPCAITYYCCAEGEDPPFDGRRYLYLTDMMRLDDTDQGEPTP